MELTVKLGNAELSNAPETAVCGFMMSVREIARYGGEPVKEMPEVKESTTKPEKKTTKTKATEKAPEEKPAKAEKAVPAPEPKKAEEPEPEKVEEPAPEPEKTEEPVEEKKEEAPASPDRAEVRKRLAEIRNEDETKAPKILEILHEFGVKKFSELPDEHLADVLAKAEAL